MEKYSPCFLSHRDQGQEVTEPDSNLTPCSGSDSSSTMDTSIPEGEDEKDSIIDYPSDKLMCSDLSDSDSRLHQQPEQCTFLPRAFPQRQFLEPAVLPNKPASRAGQAIKARFVLHQELQACRCPRAESIPSSTQGVGQHYPKRSTAVTGNNICVVCCNRYLKKHPATHTDTCSTSGGKPHSGVPHATSTSASVSAAHAGVTNTVKFSFGIEPRVIT